MIALFFNMTFGAIVNHLRGGGGAFGAWFADWFDKHMPGRELYYTSLLWGLLTWPYFGWKAAILHWLANLLWGVWAWGRWYTQNRRARDKEHAPSAFEKFIEALPGGGNDYYAFAYRNLIGQAFGAIFITPWFLLLVPLQTLAYDIPYRIIKPSSTGAYAGAIPAAELTFGVAQGAFLTYLWWTGITYSPITEWLLSRI